MSHSNNVTRLPHQDWDERILIFANGQLVNTFLVITERYVVVIDTMINEATGAQLLAAAQPYLSATRSLLVINTHADYDHAWGNQVFGGPSADHQAPIIAHQASIKQLRDPKALAFAAKLQTEEAEIFSTLELVEPTILFSERLTIDGGDLTLDLRYMPGHTDDHIVIYIPEIDTLIAADGAEPPFPYAHTVAGMQPMRASLAAMEALDCETVLYCHAPPSVGKQLITDNIAYFDAIEAACRAALARGVDSADLPTDPNELISLIDCPYDTVINERDGWPDIHPRYRTQDHARQLRMMLTVLST